MQKYMFDQLYPSADAQVVLEENLVSLVSLRPIRYDKHHKEFLNNHVKDSLGCQISQQQGYSEDGNVADIHNINDQIWSWIVLIHVSVNCIATLVGNCS